MLGILVGRGAVQVANRLMICKASIARIEGQNWRHGDIEDTLLNILMSRAAGGKKFSKLDVKRVYFGNWYGSQYDSSREQEID